MTSPGYSMYHHGPPSPVFDGADSFPGFRRVKPLPKSKRRRTAPYNTGYPPAGITPGQGADGQGEGVPQHHWAYRNPAVAGSHTAAAPGTIPTDPGGPGHGGGGVFPPFFLPHLPPPATREEEQRQQELLHRATTGFLASLEGLQLPGPEATAEELLAHAETLSARMQSYYAAHSQIPPMPPAGFPLQTQASHQLPPPMPMPMPTGFPLMNARPPPHLLSSILGPPPPLPSGASVGGGAQTGLELPPLGPAVANAGDGEEVTLPPPTNIPLPSPSSLYAQAHNIGLGLGYSLGMAGMTSSGGGGGAPVPTSSAATDYLHWAYQRQQAVAASTASAPSAVTTEPDRDYYDRYRDADRDSDYGQRNGPNNNKKRKVPANAHGRLLGGRGTAEGDLLDLDFATVDSGNGNGQGQGGGGAGMPGGLGGLEAEIDELAAGMLGALGGIGGGGGGDKGRGSAGRGQYTRRLEDDDEDPDGRGTYDRPVTPSGAGSGDPRPPPQQHSSLSLLLAAKKKSKLTAATLAALQRKELVASRRRQLAAALGPPPNAPDLSQPPPMPPHPSKRNPNAPPPPQPVPKSDAGLAMEQALLTACLRPLVNSSLVNAGGNKGTPGGGKKQLPAPVNEKGEKMRLSKRTCVRLGRVAKKVPRHPDQMPFPVLKAFGFRWESAAGERAVATQEEATAWRNRFEAELARQSNKAATKGGASTKSHNASNSISSAKGASPRKGPKSKKAQRAAANAARNVSGGVGAGEEAKFIDPISGETTNVMPGTLPPPASIGSGPTTSGKGGAQPTPTPAPIAGTNSTNSSQATPPPQGGKQSPVPATTSKKKKKRSALANASNPHHLRNYVPSRLPASAGGGGNGGPGDILGWPIPVRFLSAEIAPKKKGKRHSAPANNTDGSGLPLTNPADEWICAYCEYALFYGGSKGSGGSYKKAVKNRKKILKRRRRARERAALAASGKGGVKEVEKGQEGNEDDWDGAKGYEEGPDKSVPATVGGGNVKGRGAGAGGGGKGDQGGYG